MDHAATADERDGRAPVRGGQRYNEEANAVMYPAMRATIPPPHPPLPPAHSAPRTTPHTPPLDPVGPLAGVTSMYLLALPYTSWADGHWPAGTHGLGEGAV